MANKTTIPLYRNLPQGDSSLVGSITLDLDLLPPDPFFSIGLVSKKVAPFTGRPVAASLVDDFDLYAALNMNMAPGQEVIQHLVESR